MYFLERIPGSWELMRAFVFFTRTQISQMTGQLYNELCSVYKFIDELIFAKQ